MIGDPFDIAAKREGWAIFDCDGSEAGRYQICRLDDAKDWAVDLGFTPPQLSDDSDAWLIVRTGTSPHHSDARKFIAENAPEEWKRINEWYATQHPKD